MTRILSDQQVPPRWFFVANLLDETIGAPREFITAARDAVDEHVFSHEWQWHPLALGSDRMRPDARSCVACTREFRDHYISHGSLTRTDSPPPSGPRADPNAWRAVTILGTEYWLSPLGPFA